MHFNGKILTKVQWDICLDGSEQIKSQRQRKSAAGQGGSWFGSTITSKVCDKSIIWTWRQDGPADASGHGRPTNRTTWTARDPW